LEIQIHSYVILFGKPFSQPKFSYFVGS